MVKMKLIAIYPVPHWVEVEEELSQMSETEIEYRKYDIVRDGKRPLSFRGVLLAHVSSHKHQGPHQNRWDEYTLYRTKGGKYVVEHEYCTQWQGESDSHEAWVADTAEAAIREASEWDTGDFPDIEMPALLVELAEEAGIDVAEHID